MSLRYKGAVISATPPTTSTSGAAGSWTLQQQMQAQGSGAWPFGGPFNYIEDVFSTYLYTGNGSTQTITNGIDLAGKGGMTWIKNRTAAYDHILGDTARGASVFLRSNTTDPQSSTANHFSSFNSNGFSIGSNANVNLSSNNYASWAFRKQPKFFDVVTWTGDGVAGRQIPHSLGSVPGCIIVKCTSNSTFWAVYHQSSGASNLLRLNTVDGAVVNSAWNSTSPSSTVFTVGNSAAVNQSGYTYVAYLFAHDAGGFGLTGTDNVISCGSFTTDGSGNATVNLGYEPQYLLLKCTNTASSWLVQDTMRGFSNGNYAELYPNSSGAEVAGTPSYIAPNATGFSTVGTTNILGASNTYIYIAIRRGPMKVPTTGTSVFAPIATSASGGTPITTGFSVDAQIQAFRAGASPNNSRVMSRLTGVNSPQLTASLPYLLTSSTAAEASAVYTDAWNNTGFEVPAALGGGDAVYWNFGRAPGFMDVCCYTGNGVDNTQINHNLTVAPEFVIVKRRNDATGWSCYYPATNIGLQLNGTNAGATPDFSGVSATTFTVRNFNATNANGSTYVAYLFASCPGVSKVGSYTGTGTTQQINCGFTGGARFVLIKRTDSTGAWYVWDSARGIVAGNDPYLLLNSTAAEVTSTDYVDTYSAGFEISSTAPAAINANGGSFIYLAIA